ncbi:MAG: hypothetical protein AAF481_00365 [Acidobacteriota bacterium]
MPKDSRSKMSAALYGAFGAIAPDILLLYSKRWTMPSFEFHLGQYVLATLVYLGLASVVAYIFPYRGARTPWKAFAVGFSLPVILAGLLSVQRGVVLTPRGTSLGGRLLDLMSLF